MVRPYQRLLAVILGTTLTAFAQPASEDAPGTVKKPPRTGSSAPGQFFAAADANKDGKVSLAEIQTKQPQFPAKRFRYMDKNGDGVLTRNELPSAGPKGRESSFTRVDLDKDGKIALEEFKKHYPNAEKTRFTTMDRNGNGFLERNELPQRPQKGRGAPEKADRRANTGSYVARLVAKHDKDNDKKLTLEELQIAKPGFPESTFNALDRDKNRILDRQDVVVPQKKKRAKAKSDSAKGKKQGSGSRRKGDRNNDGKLSFEEAQVAYPNLTRERFDRRDRNSDGFLSSADRSAR